MVVWESQGGSLIGSGPGKNRGHGREEWWFPGRGQTK